MNQFDPHTSIERILPLGLPRLSISLPAFVKFIGQQMIASADELETEKQPVAEEVEKETEGVSKVEEENAKVEAEITEEDKVEKAQPVGENAEVTQNEKEQSSST